MASFNARLSRAKSSVPNVIFYSGLALLTAGNVAYQWARSRPSDGMTVSGFTVGLPFPSVPFYDPGPGPKVRAQAAGVGQCRLVVVFSSTCPHCHTAAQRAAALPDAERLPTTWVAVQNDSLARDFGRRLGQGSVLRYTDDAKDALKVRAVPAAFLLAPDDRVRAVFPYTGTESAAKLREICARPATGNGA